MAKSKLARARDAAKRLRSNIKEQEEMVARRVTTVAGGGATGLYKRFDAKMRRGDADGKGATKGLPEIPYLGKDGTVATVLAAGAMLTGSERAADAATGASAVAVDRLASGLREYDPRAERVVKLTPAERRAIETAVKAGLSETDAVRYVTMRTPPQLTGQGQGQGQGQTDEMGRIIAELESDPDFRAVMRDVENVTT